MAPSIRYEPDYAVEPGRSLRSTLSELGLTQADLAARTGLSQKHINQIVQGIAPITPETALFLERATHVPARTWSAMEAVYRERLARRHDEERFAEEADWLQDLPIRELVKRGYVNRSDSKGRQVEQVCRFFGVADRERWRRVWLAPLVSYRQSTSFDVDTGAVATWLRLGELKAQDVDVDAFDAKRFRRALTYARELTVKDSGVALKRLQHECANAGVAIIFLAEISGTRTSGAARWLTPSKALIQLSDRYKADDQFWFSFFHEAAHLLLHSKKEMFVSPADRSAISEDEEDEANSFAEAHLIPGRYKSWLHSLRTNRDVIEFADELGIAPGIVVGRLHNDGIWGWSRGNLLKRKISFDELVRD
jgi:HTH-type transcriptional regulator / antitoxin HigA